MPLSSFTLLFSELTTDPRAAFVVVDNLRFEIPTTPWVCAVIGGCDPLVLLPLGASPVAGEVDVGGGVPAPIRPPAAPPGDVPPGLGAWADGPALSFVALLAGPEGAMIA